MSNDILRRFIFEDKDIKGAWVSLDKSILDLYRKQDHYPVALKRLLNESLAASVLLSTMLKFEGMLSLQARGDGDINLFLAEMQKSQDNDIKVRGIIRLSDEDQEMSEQRFENTNLPELLGQAYLAVSIQPEDAKAYQGLVSLEKDSFSENLQDYFTQSEQLDTYFQLASEGDRVVGFMLQRLPEGKLDQVESSKSGSAKSDHDWEHCLQLCNTLTNDELLGIDEQTLLCRLFHEEEVRLFDEEPVNFHCGCSKERMEKALIGVGQKEVMDMLKEQPSIDMHCELCGNEYDFDLTALTQLFGITQSTQIN